MNCEIIAVGDEVLTGDIVNTNAREIAAGLEDAGVRVRRQTVTSDNPAEIRQTLAEAFDRSDVIAYIERTGREYEERVAALEAENETLRKENQTLENTQRVTQSGASGSISLPQAGNSPTTTGGRP